MKLNLLKKTIYAGLMIVSFFALLELCLCVVDFSGRADDTRFVLNPEWDYPEVFDKDHDLFWKFHPSQVIESDFFVEGEYHINSHRLRGPDFSEKKGPGVFRIVCLGNSCTFGWRIEEEQVFPRQLERMLANSLPGTTYEVINAGVTGYSSLQGLRFLKKEVLNWHPDLLVVSYGWNDHWAGAQDIADKDQRLPPQWVLDIQNLLGRTLTYRWLKYIVFSVKKPPPADFSRTRPVYRVGLDDFRENLARIVKESANRGIEVIFLTAPITSHPSPEHAGLYAYHAQYNEIIRSFTGTSGGFVVDAAARFLNNTGLFDRPEDDLKHYNANGHKLIAGMIADLIASRHRDN